ncbi:MAG: hypothetical protein EOM54_03395 [Clostridia bacterium]|nr:hypothetical protein [Clostridia bacterium]
MTEEIKLIDHATCELETTASLINAALYILDDTKDTAIDAGREGDVFWISEVTNLLNLGYCRLMDVEKSFDNLLNVK